MTVPEGDEAKQVGSEGVAATHRPHVLPERQTHCAKFCPAKRGRRSLSEHIRETITRRITLSAIIFS